MDWHDISALYVQIELMLIASLKRNLTKHEDWEQDKGFAWPAWQAVKLREMEQYRRQNQKLMQPYQTVIHDETAKEIKRQLAEGYGSSGDPQFFRGNRRYLDSLTHDMLHIEQKAERAALRMMDDVYRQTLSKAQLAMAAGASSLQQAVDMATRDFLAQGINCIVYKDGSRHNIADYVQMALRTTAIRAYLQGEAIKRAELGIDTVVVSQYGACSETCLPWQGRVYIDDVWGDFRGERRGNEGLSVNGRWYPLLSVAVRGGLFHPNCRHTLSTWQEGISTLPEPLDPEKIRETAALEQRQRALERRVRKLKRLAEGTLDPVQQAAYKKQVRAAQAELRAFVGEHDDVLRRSYWREKTYGVPEIKRRAAFSPIPRNTGKSVYFDERADYSIRLPEHSKELQDGLSKASLAVAQAGGKDGMEHLCLVETTKGEIVYEETGTGSEVGGRAFWDFIKRHPDQNFAFVHNHNTDGCFSDADLRTVLTTPNLPIMVAVRIDGVKYLVERRKMAPNYYSYDKLYPDEIKALNEAYRNGTITAGERTHLREELLVNNLIRDYTKGLIELDGRS